MNMTIFAGGDWQASADFFVDSDNIIQIIDTDNYYSWHCGDGGGAYGISNKNSLGIEMCLSDDGNLSNTTISNTLDLVKYLMSKYGINIDHVVRHYDASSSRSIVKGWNQNSTGWWYWLKDSCKMAKSEWVMAKQWVLLL